MTTDVEPLPTTLDGWLARCERLHPKEIDMTLVRVRQVKERLGLDFSVPVIAVAGTNGKGSTCAMLATSWRQWTPICSLAVSITLQPKCCLCRCKRQWLQSTNIVRMRAICC